MLIDASVHGPEAARALRRWRWGLVVALMGSLLSSVVMWTMWYGSIDIDLGDSSSTVFLIASGLGLLASGVVFLGVRDYVAAIQGSLGVLPRVVFVAAGIELAVSGLWFAIQGVELAMPLGLLSSGGLLVRVLGFVSIIVSPLTTVAAVMLFGRISTMIGARLSPVMIVAVVGVVVARFGLRVLQELDLGEWSVRGLQSALYWGGELLFLALISLHARALAACRPLVPGGASSGDATDQVDSDSMTDASAWEAPGRALAVYRNTIVVQIVLSMLAMLAMLATRSTPEAVGKVVSGAAILGLVVSLVLVLSVARYATSLPALHASGPAKLGVSLFAFNAFVGLVTTVLVVRAFSSGRLGHLFDLRDQLPVLEAVGTFFGLGGLLALLFSFDALGRELGERALPVRTRGLKVALVILVVAGTLAKLGAGVLGPMVAVFALGFAIGALVTIFSYLRVVSDVSALLLARAGVF